MQASAPDAREEPIVLAARKEAKRILESHRPVQLEKGVRQGIKDLLRKYDEMTIKKTVPTAYLDRFE
jgi:trimethylamine:corrinoid methyltransferase-like protein